MCMVRVGSKVQVVREGMQYVYYPSWIKHHFPEYLTNCESSDYKVKNGDVGVVLGKAKHLIDNKLLALVLINGTHVVIINENALTVLEHETQFSNQEMLDLLQINSTLKFESNGCVVGLYNNYLHVFKQGNPSYPAKIHMDAEWKLVRIGQKVDFLTAFRAYRDGATIACGREGTLDARYVQDDYSKQIFHEEDIALGNWYILD